MINFNIEFLQILSKINWKFHNFLKYSQNIPKIFLHFLTIFQFFLFHEYQYLLIRFKKIFKSIKVRESEGKFQKSDALSLKDQNFSKFSYSENILNIFFHLSQWIRYTPDSHHLEKYAKLHEVNQLTAKITFINSSIPPSNPHVASYCSVTYCRDIATFDIVLLQCERSCTNEYVLFISDVLLYCLVI